MKSNWQIKKLGEVVNVLDNLRKPINSTERLKRINGKDQKDLFPYYGATGQVGWIDSFITNGEFILVGEDGAPFLDNFKNKAYKISGRTWVNNHAHILKEKENITLNNFILYYLNSIDYRQYVNGTTRLKLTKGSLTEIPFPLPPLETQQAIVSKIEELFSELDKGIEDLKTAQQQLKTYRQSVLKWAFEGKLTNDNVKEGALPNGWEKVKLNDIGKIVSGGTPSTNNHLYWNGNINWIAPSDLTGYKGILIKTGKKSITQLGLQKSSAKLIPRGSILFSSRAPIGYVVIADSELCTNQGFKSIIPNSNIDSLFVYYFLKSSKQEAEKVASGTTFKEISLRSFSELSFPLPPLKEQHLIVQEIESRLSVADKMEESIAQSLQQAEALRQSILKKAFSGELV